MSAAPKSSREVPDDEKKIGILNGHGTGGDLGPIPSHNLSVLVVNEEADILDEVAALLRRRSLSVHLANSADQARDAMVRHPEIGVLVADISLLEGEGLALAAQVLGGRPPLQPVELVLITGYAGAGGASGPLMKQVGLLQEPLRLRDIAAAVGKALARAATRRSLARHEDARRSRD